MRHSPTVAVALSLSACDAGDRPPEPTPESPESIDVWSTSVARTESPPAEPAVRAKPAEPRTTEPPTTEPPTTKLPTSKLPTTELRATELRATELPTAEARRFTGVMRAYPKWEGERVRVRVLDRARRAASAGRVVEDELTGAESQVLGAEQREREALKQRFVPKLRDGSAR